MISIIRQNAKKYPGSYALEVEGRAKINGKIVTFIAYTNPQNSSSAKYIEYRVGGNDYGITSYNLDIYDLAKVKETISSIGQI